MNFLRVSFTAASHKTFRHMLRSGGMIRGFATTAGNLESEHRRGDFVTYNTLINDLSKAEEPSHADRTRQLKRLSPNKSTYMFLIDSFCKQDRFDVAYRVLKEMILSGFSPPYVTSDNILGGFIRIGAMRNAYEMYKEMNINVESCWPLLQGLSDEVTYTSLMNAYLDEGKWDNAEQLFYEMEYLPKTLRRNEITHICCLPDSVLYSVFINGLDNKARTTQIKKELLMLNYNHDLYLYRSILEFHLTLAENCSYDEFKSLVELVESFCDRDDLENAYDTMVKSNYYKPDGIDDGIVCNLFVIAHCQYGNIVDAYIMYQEMVRYGFACHMFTVIALIRTLSGSLQYQFGKNKNMGKDNEILWVIQNVLRSCNVNDSEIVNYLNEFNPEDPISDALYDVLAEKAKDGPFLKCSYAPPSA